MTSAYHRFLATKAQEGCRSGFEPLWIPSFLFPFQAHLTDFAIRQGRGALFTDCGTGKSAMLLSWSENVIRYTNKPVLVLTPLAVGAQLVAEAEKFGIEARRAASQAEVAAPGIYITNYEKLHLIDQSKFGGVVCDESSAIKAFDGRRRAEVTEFLRRVKYRLLDTATAAPNDYTELGTSSEALGHLGLTDMLTRFFVNDQRNVSVRRAWAGQSGGSPKWRFKGHAPAPFWRWISSWARACRLPSDLGFEDDGFILPALVENEHVVAARSIPEGYLFPVTAGNMREEREERRRTIRERCEMVASLVDHDQPAVVWCHLNDESDLLEELIPDGRQVTGSQPEEKREEIYNAFTDGSLRVIILKPKLGAWGLNWQHCNHVVTFYSHSFEQDYQAIRRCWRFGQTRTVTVDRVATEGEIGIRANLRRKAEAADAMFSELVRYMREAVALDIVENHVNEAEVPSWL